LWEEIHASAAPRDPRAHAHRREAIRMQRLRQTLQQQKQLEGSHDYPYEHK